MYTNVRGQTERSDDKTPICVVFFNDKPINLLVRVDPLSDSVLEFFPRGG